jgi:hypothetical protein
MYTDMRQISGRVWCIAISFETRPSLQHQRGINMGMAAV